MISEVVTLSQYLIEAIQTNNIQLKAYQSFFFLLIIYTINTCKDGDINCSTIDPDVAEIGWGIRDIESSSPSSIGIFFKRLK